MTRTPPLKNSEGVSIRYRALGNFRKRGGYKVQLNFSALFFRFFSDQFNFYLCNDWVNTDDLMVIRGRQNVLLLTRNLNLASMGPSSNLIDSFCNPIYHYGLYNCYRLI